MAVTVRGGLFASIAVAALTTAPALASSGGIAFFSGQFGVNCNACHSGGVAPEVTLVGPTSVQPGQVSAYTLRMTIPDPSPTNQQAGGLDVSADGGTLLVAEAGTHLDSGEITHDAPRMMNASRRVVFRFDWMAPLTAGTYTLYGAGNAVNLGFTPAGDLATSATLAVTVVGATPTPGETSGESLAPLLVTAFDPNTGDMELSYAVGCETDDANLYYGPLDQVASYGYTGEVCAIGADGVHAGFNPGPGSFFFLVVGTKDSDEGSYGIDLPAGGLPVERPPFAGNACGQVQTLADRCD